MAQQNVVGVSYDDIEDLLVEVEEDDKSAAIDCQTFLPCGAVSSLTQKNRVKATLRKWFGSELKVDHVTFFTTNAQKVFLLLVFIDADKECVKGLYEARLKDSDLPLCKPPAKSGENGNKKRTLLSAENAKPWDCFETWRSMKRNEFHRHQGKFLAPKFDTDKFSYVFYASQSLPFVPRNTETKPDGGYFGTVEMLGLHVDHLNPQKDDRLSRDEEYFQVAVKCLKPQQSSDERGTDIHKFYEKELQTLYTMKKLNNPHLIKAVAAYKKGKDKCFVFPWAQNGNLGNFWKTSTMSVDKQLISWAIGQMKGMTKAIKMLHDQKTRHGDIKPDNILLFANSDGSNNPGTLVIADVGLAKVHEQYTRYRHNSTTTRHGSLSYEPPEILEYVQGVPVPHVYDIWALGCVFLEFTIWLVYGQPGWKRFLAAITDKYGDRRFWLDDRDSGPKAHPMIEEWVKKIKAKLEKKSALWEVAHLISTRLLVPMSQDSCAKSLQDILIKSISLSEDIQQSQSAPAKEVVARLEDIRTNSSELKIWCELNGFPSGVRPRFKKMEEKCTSLLQHTSDTKKLQAGLKEIQEHSAKLLESRPDGRRASAEDVYNELDRISSHSGSPSYVFSPKLAALAKLRPSGTSNSHDLESSDGNNSILSPSDSTANTASSTSPAESMSRRVVTDPITVSDQDESDINSIFRLPDDPVTNTIDSKSGTDGINALMVREVTELFRRDEVLTSFISAAASQKENEFERRRSKFRKLVEHCGRNLKVETSNNRHQKLAEFVSSHAENITMELFSTQPLRNRQDREEDQRTVNEYLRGFGNSRKSEQDPTPDSDPRRVTGSTDERVDEKSYHHLQSMKTFILESAAYDTLHRRLSELVYPTFHSKIRDLSAALSKPDHEHNAYVTPYELLNLLAELRYIDPSNVQVHDDEATAGSWRSSLGFYQNLIEKRTQVRWDWWPLPKCPRPLEKSESRVRWKCTCGETRWAEVPSPFAECLRSILNSLSRTTAHGLGPTSTSNVQDSNRVSAGRSGHVSNLPPGGGRGSQQTAGSPKDNTLQPASQANDATAPPAVTNYRVLFLVKRGSDYELAQICVRELNCRLFLSKLREEYFHLRGFFRGWLSVWRYSHCDFYKCEKFGGSLFAPREEDFRPNKTDYAYEENPKKSPGSPPITAHEFRTCFYACHQPRAILHWYHKCRKLEEHSHDLLEFIPKKKTEFEKWGNGRDDFWGIYAREMVSFGWVLLYNLVCILPMLIFYIAWAVPSGRGTDLQNPSVPFSMMIAMLSLFWSLFLSTLQFGESK